MINFKKIMKNSDDTRINNIKIKWNLEDDSLKNLSIDERKQLLDAAIYFEENNFKETIHICERLQKKIKTQRILLDLLSQAYISAYRDDDANRIFSDKRVRFGIVYRTL